MQKKRMNGVRTAALMVGLLACHALGSNAQEGSQQSQSSFFALRSTVAVPPSSDVFSFSPAEEKGVRQSQSLSALTAPNFRGRPTGTAQTTTNGPRPSQLDASGGNGLFTTMGVGMFVAATGDLATTELGLSRPNIVEVNPLQRNRIVRISTHAAVPALLWWITERTHDTGKTKLALIMRIGFTAAYSYALMHNARTLGGQR